MPSRETFSDSAPPALDLGLPRIAVRAWTTDTSSRSSTRAYQAERRDSAWSDLGEADAAVASTRCERRAGSDLHEARRGLAQEELREV